MMRPRGRPPTPSATSSERAPVGMTAISSSGPPAPRRMTEPLPNCRSIWAIARSSACRRSFLVSAMLISFARWPPLLSEVDAILGVPRKAGQCRRSKTGRIVDGDPSDAVSAVPTREPIRGKILPRVRHQAEPRLRRVQQQASGAARSSATSAAARSEPILRLTLAGKFASPESYTPRHLAERILTSRSALEGERKQVTVLFADLKGSMELLADRDPEEARRAPRPGARADDGGRPPLRGHRQPGHGRRHHGAVRRAARPRGPRRARLLRRPAACRSTCGRYAERGAPQRGVDVQIRVGLNSGEVVVRSIGSDLRMDYTASARRPTWPRAWSSWRRPGTILAAAGDAARWSRATSRSGRSGPMPVKGLDEPVEVYELVGAGPRPLAPAGRGGARADPLRRARRRELDALAAGAGAGATPATARSSALVGRAGRRQVAAGLGVHPLASAAGLARAGERLRLLRQGDGVPAGDRPAQERTSGSRRATTPRTIREKVDRQAADARPAPRADPAAAAGAARRRRSTTRRGRRSTRRSAASAPWTP